MSNSTLNRGVIKEPIANEYELADFEAPEEVATEAPERVASEVPERVASEVPEVFASEVSVMPSKKDSYDLNMDNMDYTEDTPKEEQWKEKTTREKIFHVLIRIVKVVVLFCSLYLFICSLDLLSVGFKLVSESSTRQLFQRKSILGNPIVGVMIGTLITVLVQSSSTTTSILVGLVSAHIMTVQVAIPFIMGANIGTSITNAFVSFGQIQVANEFKLAFAGACVHDAFNLMTVLVLLPVEITTGYLRHFTGAIVYQMHKKGNHNQSTTVKKTEFLTKLTKPLVNKIVHLDSKMLTQIAIKGSKNTSKLIKSTIFPQESMSSTHIGIVVLIIAVVVLISCLLVTVKILKSMLGGKLSSIVKRTVNANIPHAPWLAGYIAILVGTFMTILLQSSSVFTSAMTPLIGLGVITIDRAYPLTLGSNVGTTITAIIASLAIAGESFYPAFQIALCHLFFNVTGIVLFYPIPFMRIPIRVAKFLGRQTSKYRWYAIAYLLVVFLLFPLLILGLSFAGDAYVIVFVAICLLISIFVLTVNVLRSKRPTWLPSILRTWEWLPIGLRSLKPYDKVFRHCICCLVKDIVVIAPADAHISQEKDSSNATLLVKDDKLETSDNINSKENARSSPGDGLMVSDVPVRKKDEI